MACVKYGLALIDVAGCDSWKKVDVRSMWLLPYSDVNHVLGSGISELSLKSAY